jgi:hypothetical protein
MTPNIRSDIDPYNRNARAGENPCQSGFGVMSSDGQHAYVPVPDLYASVLNLARNIPAPVASGGAVPQS